MSCVAELTFAKHRAFTLVEVLVSMAILSTALLAVFGVFRMCSKASTASRRLTESTLLAEKLLVETSLDNNLGFQAKNGTEGLFDWLVKTSPTEVENLALIEVTVQWPQQMSKKNYQLTSLIYIPSAYEGK